MKQVHPILYSFRRCPYAMRARLALKYAQIPHEHREVVLKDKPDHMLEISPKGTVPVLLTTSQQTIDESIDIMHWALNISDPEHYLPDLHRQDIYSLIERNDTHFKPLLDRYKYPNRYPDEAEEDLGKNARDKTLAILNDLDQRIKHNNNLSGNKQTLADIAIFPFIRQFRNVDKEWFEVQPMPHLQKWLQTHLTGDLFTSTMEKHTKWTPELEKTYVNL